MIPSTTLPRLAVTGCLLLALHGTAPAVVEIETVPIGNAGNPVDPIDPTLGSVSYELRMATYETSISDYCEFLNATAASDPYGLYNAEMGTNLNVAGIARAGAPGSYSYSVIGDGNRPITYVNYYDAARFANWLHNGQGSGGTETGAYTLNGASTGPIIRNPGATVWLPNESEWYKAAFYNGATGTYPHDFATRSSDVPGTTIGASFNQANYNGDTYATTGSGLYSPTANYLTPGGAFSGSASYYGTYDQNGNVTELVDVQVPDALLGRTRGGSWNDGFLSMLKSDAFLAAFDGENSETGFRLAFVIPEPSHAILGAMGLGMIALRRRRDAM